MNVFYNMNKSVYYERSTRVVYTCTIWRPPGFALNYAIKRRPVEYKNASGVYYLSKKKKKK